MEPNSPDQFNALVALLATIEKLGARTGKNGSAYWASVEDEYLECGECCETRVDCSCIDYDSYYDEDYRDIDDYVVDKTKDIDDSKSS